MLNLAPFLIRSYLWREFVLKNWKVPAAGNFGAFTMRKNGSKTRAVCFFADGQSNLLYIIQLVIIIIETIRSI